MTGLWGWFLADVVGMAGRSENRGYNARLFG
jgi:hypothetical protein